MELNNHLGWKSFIFRQYNPLAELNVSFTTFRVYEIRNGTELVESQDDNRAVQLKDEYVGEKHLAHLFRQADFIPFKLGTDVTAIAQSWSPTGNPEKNWETSIEINRKEKKIAKRLRVYGPRMWKKTSFGKWTLTEPEAVISVPLDYYHAFGGEKLDEPIVEGAPRNCNLFNPVGPGIIENSKFKPERAFPAPQIEDADTSITSPLGDYQPQGFAPIAPVWRFRQQYAGTYDQEWLDTHHPFLPTNFDYRFYNCAHPDLIINPYLHPGDVLRAINLHPYFKQIEFNLPEFRIGALCRYKNAKTEFSTMVLDGVHLELLQSTPKVRLTWRGAFPWNQGIELIDIGKLDFERVNKLLAENAEITGALNHV